MELILARLASRDFISVLTNASRERFQGVLSMIPRKIVLFARLVTWRSRFSTISTRFASKYRTQSKIVSTTTPMMVSMEFSSATSATTKLMQ